MGLTPVKCRGHYFPNISTGPSLLPLVLTYGDISIYNVRFGTDGKVWPLDWEHAGAYNLNGLQVGISPNSRL